MTRRRQRPDAPAGAAAAGPAWWPLTAGLIGLGLLWALLSSPAMGQAQGHQMFGEVTEEISLQVNKGMLLRLDRPAEEVFIANPAIADVQVRSPQLLYVLGVGQGDTSLLALDEDGNPLYGATVTVSGNLSRLRRMLANLLPEARIEAESVEGLLVLRGSVANAEQAERAERLSLMFTSKETLVNELEITQPTQVNLRVKFAEVSRSLLKQIGFDWATAFNNSDVVVGLATGSPNLPQGIPFQGSGPLTFFPEEGSSNSVFGSFNGSNVDAGGIVEALENEGFVSVLAEPNLSAISGETASFLAGGEFPVPIQDEDGIGVEFKPFGVSLSFTPFVRSDRMINIRVRPEVSELTNTGAVTIGGTSVPGVTTRKVQTTVELGSGQSFAIAGLLQNDLTHDVSKVPGLGDLPVLGALFKSDSFQRDESELLVVVTPYLVRPVSDSRIALPTDGLTPPSDAERYLLDRKIKRLPLPSSATPPLEHYGSQPSGE